MCHDYSDFFVGFSGRYWSTRFRVEVFSRAISFDNFRLGCCGWSKSTFSVTTSLYSSHSFPIQLGLGQAAEWCAKRTDLLPLASAFFFYGVSKFDLFRVHLIPVGVDLGELHSPNPAWFRQSSWLRLCRVLPPLLPASRLWPSLLWLWFWYRVFKFGTGYIFLVKNHSNWYVL